MQRALETYTVLTIGDGLVTVIPALMISISGGLIVTRASSDAKLGADFQRQVFGNSQPLLLAAGVLWRWRPFPGLPKFPFLLLGGGVGRGGVAYAAKTARGRKERSRRPPPPPRENLEALLRVEPLAVEVGLGLVQLVEGGAGFAAAASASPASAGSWPPNSATSCRRCASPTISRCKAREYVISLKGVEIARYELPQGCELAIHSDDKAEKIEGIPTREPAFGMPARLDFAGATPRRRAVRATPWWTRSAFWARICGVVRRHAHELFSRQDAKKLLDRVAEEQSQGGRGFGAQIALPGSGAESFAESVARAGFDSRRGQHSGSAGRSRAHHQEHGAAHRIRAAGHPPPGGEAAARTPPAICRPISSIQPSSRPSNRPWSTAKTPAT